MPIHAVNWPNMTLSIIEALDKKDLYDKIEVENPMCAAFKKLSKPLFINLTFEPEDKNIPKPTETKISPAQKMADMMSDKNFFDVTVRVHNGIEFKCHKVVLASCEYFCKLFKSQMKETISSVINIVDL